MATACPSPPRPLLDGAAPPARTDAAEGAWRSVIDAQAADLRTVRRLRDDPGGAGAAQARARLRARTAPGGAVEAAMAAVRDAYGGEVPLPVRRRLERYVVEHLHSGGPTP